MRKLLLLLLLCSSLPAFSQGVMSQPQTAFKTVNGLTTPIANATITVCAALTGGIPCSPALVSTIFKDVALTQPLSNPFTTDSSGNYQFAAAAGTYTVTVTASGFSGYSYQLSLNSGGGGGGGGGGLSGQTPGQVPIANTSTTANSSKAIQGTGTSLMSADTVSSTPGTPLCVDANAAATTTGCGSSGVTGMVAGQVPIAGSATTITSSIPIQGTDSSLLSSGSISGQGNLLCLDANLGATSAACNFQPSLPSGLVAQYSMPSSEQGTTTLVDYSGNGNNGSFPGGANNPTRLAVGGLSFVGSSSQFITLPSAVGACRSWVFAYDNNIVGSNTQNMLLEQATNAAAGIEGYGIANDGTQFDAANNLALYRVVGNTITGTTGCSSGAKTQATESGQGSHVFIATSDVSTLEHIYIDGLEPNIYGSSCTVNGTTTRYNTSVNYQLGGSNIFANRFFTGKIYYAACWNRGLAPFEVASVNSSITTLIQQRTLPKNTLSGFPINSVSSGPVSGTAGQDIVLLDGDSIMAGSANQNQNIAPWATKLVLVNSPNVTIYNTAQAGWQLVAHNLANTFGYDGYYNPWATRNVFVEESGLNDIAASIAQPLIEGGYANICTEKTKVGFKCLVTTITSNGGTVPRANVNAYNRQHFSEYAVGLVDYGGDPTIGCDTCNASFDTVHPNIWESAAIMQYYLQRAINRVVGAHDFTSAPVYASAAAAANTVTAATDTAQIGTSGKSTATYTFATNLFTVGQSVTCTNITPAGYNQTFTVATASGTQITGIINTASLGAGTVFGTCSAPQSEDMYATLNFGAGNFTIGTACGYTGQRIYLKNINAAGSTIVSTSMPNESAEQFDGAANLTIASNQLRILESKTTGLPSTPQCGWAVIQ